MPAWPEALTTDTVAMARELLGWWLLVATPAGVCGGPITETEAYTRDDPASHSFRGPTRRNRAMFGPPGHLYVYRIYGIHWCCNLVTGAEGQGEAILLRALRPELGLDLMRERRGVAPGARCERGVSDGPGKVCQALALDGSWDGVPVQLAADIDAVVTGPADHRVLLVPRDGTLPPVSAGTRVGISRATERPWRFRPAVSPE